MLTEQEIRAAAEKGEYIEGKVYVYIEDLVDNNEEWLNDNFSLGLTGEECLGDISYEVVGGEDSHVIFDVAGDPKPVVAYWDLYCKEQTEEEDDETGES